MATSPLRDLPEDSLASLDKEGHRLFIYPAMVRGLWHRRRLITQAVLLFIFLILPWVRVGGHQALLLDIPRRQFAIFGLTFWAHDGPMIFFVFASLIMTLALVTAIWGRVWCGWACPQTVFIEMVYRTIERWAEGNHIARRKLNESPISAEKVLRKIAKWLGYLAASLIIAHSFLAYFVGTDRVMEMVRHAPTENWTSFLVILITTGIIIIDFGWFREQFCLIACPYGRFQSVLFDEDTMAVIYDANRGEPRRGKASEKPQGDCIDCFKCVAVCPTAIDIRRGLQMECIACTACMDACDEVMAKTKKPLGLIRYSSEREISSGQMRYIRPRIAIYASVLVLILVGFGIALSRREAVHITLLRAKELPYTKTTLDNGSAGLINHFEIAAKNNEFHPVSLALSVADPLLKDKIQIVLVPTTLKLEPGANSRTHVFVKFPNELTERAGELKVHVQFEIHQEAKTTTKSVDMELVGPRMGG